MSKTCSDQSVHGVLLGHDIEQVTNGSQRRNLPLDEDTVTHKTSLLSQNLMPTRVHEKGWRSLTSLEKGLSIALGLVSTLFLAFVITVIVVAIQKRNETADSTISMKQVLSEQHHQTWLSTALPLQDGVTIMAGRIPEKNQQPKTVAPTTTTTPRSAETEGRYKAEEDRTCMTTECLIAAGEILKNIDTKIDPCDDFYQFSCGGWLENNFMTMFQTQWGRLDAMGRKINHEIRNILEIPKLKDDPLPLRHAKDFYDTCTTQGSSDDDLLLLIIVLSQVLRENANATKTTTTTARTTDRTRSNLGALGKIKRELGGNYIFHFDLNEEFSGNNAIQIYFSRLMTELILVVQMDQPVLGLPTIYLLDESNNEHVDAYAELIVKLWSTVYPDDDADRVAKNIIAFEKSIANISTKVEDRRNKPDMYHSLTIADLYNFNSNRTSEVDWMDYFEEVLKDILKSNPQFSLDNNTNVIIKDKLYYQKIAEVLDETDNETILNYMKWSIIFQYGDKAGKSMGKHYVQFNKKTRGIQSIPLRWEICVQETNAHLGMSISYRYIQAKFHSSNITSLLTKIKTMVEGIRSSFLDTIDDMDWISDDETLMKSREKLEKMITLIGFPDWLMDKNNIVLSEYYQGLTLRNSSSYFQNYLDVVKWSLSRKLKSNNTDRNRWIVSPISTTAAYFPQLNSMVLPIGIMQHPCYTDFSGEIAAINYGGIGAIIGHEMTHTFGDDGILHDADGKLQDWWDDKTLENHNTLSKCFEKQYGQYTVKELANTTVNGTRTLWENIADNGGLRKAYHAYQRHLVVHGKDKRLPGVSYSPEQLFFLSYSQMWCKLYTPAALNASISLAEHSPGLIRVRGVMENSEEFAHAWSCPQSQRKLCQIW